MWGSKLGRLLYIGAIAAGLVLITPSSAQAVESSHEISTQLVGVTPNAGGISIIGVHYRTGSFEATLQYFYGLLGVGVAYHKTFNEDGYFMPHLNLGLGLFSGAPALIPGAGLTIVAIPFFSGRIGFRIDHHLPIFPDGTIFPLHTLGLSWVY